MTFPSLGHGFDPRSPLHLKTSKVLRESLEKPPHYGVHYERRLTAENCQKLPL